VVNRLAEVGSGGLLHLLDDETSNLSRRVLLADGLNPSISVVGSDDLERNVVDVTLDLGIPELSTDQSREREGEEGRRFSNCSNESFRSTSQRSSIATNSAAVSPS
jgi:hypothetical protein